MCVKVDETHHKRRPGATETVAKPGVGGVSDEVAAQRSIQEPAANGDVCVFTEISYLARRALSKRSKTPYVVILLRFTCKIRRCVEGRNWYSIQFLGERIARRVLSVQTNVSRGAKGWNGNAAMVL